MTKSTTSWQFVNYASLHRVHNVTLAAHCLRGPTSVWFGTIDIPPYVYRNCLPISPCLFTTPPFLCRELLSAKQSYSARELNWTDNSLRKLLLTTMCYMTPTNDPFLLLPPRIWAEKQEIAIRFDGRSCATTIEVGRWRQQRVLRSSSSVSVINKAAALPACSSENVDDDGFQISDKDSS